MNRKKFIIICFFLILLIAGIAVLKLRPRNQGLYKVTILPSLGEIFTMPRAINDKGQIAGYSQFSNGDNHLFIWDKENGMRDLGIYSSGNISINNSGQIVSSLVDPNGNQRAFIWDPNNGRTILPTLGGNYSFAYDINNHGQVVGSVKTSSGLKHAFVWDNINGICDLTPTSTKEAFACSVNDDGQIIVVQGSNILVNVKENKIVSISSIPFDDICCINNNGYIAGMLRDNQTERFDVGIWDTVSRHTSIIKSNIGYVSYIYHINDLNQVIIIEVFQYKSLFKRKKSYIKTKNYLNGPKLGMISLDGYIKLNKGEELGLNDINNNGCIIGAFGSEKDMNFKGVLFEPIPEKMEKMIKKKKSHK